MSRDLQKMRGVSKTHLGLGFVLNNGHDSPWTRYASLLPEMDWSLSLDVYDEFKKLIIRMNTPRVVIDNAVSENATLVKVDSANKHGILLEVVQVLTELNLNINKGYVSSDKIWFMDVFHVTDENGKKLTNEGIIGYIEKTLKRNPCILPLFGKLVGAEVTIEHTTIELIGTDRPRLLSEIFSVLSDLRCNVVEAEVWTHNRRVACLVYITDEDTSAPIEDRQKICKTEELLLTVMTGNGNIRGAKTVVSMGLTHIERRLHQLMFVGCDYEELHGTGGRAAPPLNGNNNDNARPLVAVDNYLEWGYSVVTFQCEDRAKLLFNIVCTLRDMEYVVFHATIDSQGSQTFQEFYIRHTDGCPVNSEAERQQVILCLEVAIRRRVSYGIRLELCTNDRVGLLSDMTRIFRENELSVTRAEVSTQGDKATDVFYVTDPAGNLVDTKTVEAVHREIGLTILQVKDNTLNIKSPPRELAVRFSLDNLFKTKS